MKEKIIVVSCLFTLMMNLPSEVFCQNYDLSTPEKTIEALFISMYDGDSTLARMVFADNAILNSLFTSKEGVKKVNEGKIDDFIHAIGTPHEELWDERISNLNVNMDGDLAQAWMDYSFYIGTTFSHCGVNAMHLIRKEGEWKIFQIVDTRRKTNCN